jgi:hypothetical protein
VELILLVIFVGVEIWLFKSGERIDSRKGYSVGRRHSRRRRF